MPELPEVEVVRRGLQAHVVGKTITAVRVHHPRAVRRHEAGPADLTARLLGARITGTDRRGKYLWLLLDTELPGSGSDTALVVHLGMSGQMLLGAVPRADHVRISALLDDGTVLSFADQRTFGGWMLADLVTVDGSVVPEPVAHLARDPLDPRFDADSRRESVAGQAFRDQASALDQTVVSGIGNIYADEALWRAKVNGARIAATLTRKQLGAVLRGRRRRDARRPGEGRDLVRFAVRQRQRRVRLLRPIPGRLRPRRRKLPALRSGDAPGKIYEPLVVLLSEMPAAAPLQLGVESHTRRAGTASPTSKTKECR